MIAFLKNFIERRAIEIAEQRRVEEQRRKEEEKIQIDKSRFPIGTVVICRSNEWTNLVIGPVIDYNIVHRNVMYVVEDYISGKVVVPLGVMRKYSPELLDLLVQHNPLDQWNLLNQMGQILKKAALYEDILDPEEIRRILREKGLY